MVYGPQEPLDLNVVHSGQEKRRFVTKIIIHCSDSTWGDFKAIDEWHSQRKTRAGKPWKGITFCGRKIVCGYHYIILNGHRESNSKYIKVLDGHIEKGRPDDFMGAHCKGQNLHSLGVCMIGKTKFSENQYSSLSSLITNLTSRQNMTIHGHREYSSVKTCPNFDVPDFIKKWTSAYWGT